MARLLDELGLTDTHVLGHSMGGKVAMALALHWPQRVRRLIVVDIAPFAYADRFTPLIDAMLRLDLATVATRADADRYLALDIASTPVRALLLQNLVRQRGGSTGAPSPHTCRPYWALRPGSVAVTALCRRCLCGAPNPTMCYPLIEAMFPQANFHSIAGASHWVHVDRPAELSEVVRGWLA